MSELGIKRVRGDTLRVYLSLLNGSGMPDAFRLRHHPVAKVLRAWG